jgi:nucleoid DNA-binding protein
MTKNEVIDEVARRANLGKKEAGAAVDALLATVDPQVRRRRGVHRLRKFSVSHQRRARECPPAHQRATSTRPRFCVHGPALEGDQS